MPDMKTIIQQMITDGQPEAAINEFVQKARDRQASETSWRNGADPEGSMALAGIANENPKAALGGALSAGTMMIPGVAGVAKNAIMGGLTGGAEGFVRTGSLVGAGHDALRGAVAGAGLPLAGHMVGKLATSAGQAFGKGVQNAINPAVDAGPRLASVPQTVEESVAHFAGMKPKLAPSQSALREARFGKSLGIDREQLLQMLGQ